MRIDRFIYVAGLGLALIACSKKPVAAPVEVPASRSEEAWLVQSVATDVVRLSAFAAGQATPEPSSIEAKLVDAESRKYRITFPTIKPGGTVTVDITIGTDSLDPVTYAPLAAAMRSEFAPKQDTAAYAPAAVENLTAFSVEKFLSENQRISKFLTGHPGNFSAHEDAAVLLGAFALRENSGVFWNPLPACARATAHLIVANVLPGNSAKSSDALLAHLLVGLILDTTARCQTQIEALEKFAASRPALADWVQAAKFRNTRDWRPSARAALLAKIEKFRALCDAAGTGPGVKYLVETQPANVPDWARIVMEVDWGVEDGHRFCDGMLAGEIQETAAVLGRPVPKSEPEWRTFVKALNIAPTSAVTGDSKSGPRIEVIDRAMWARSAQRHLCHAIYQTWRFLAEMWGVPDEAQKFWGQMEEAFGGLELFPVIGLLRCDSVEAVRPYAEKLRTLFDKNPELVPDVAWERAGDVRFTAVFPDVREMATRWFAPPILPGTAYEFGSRWGRLPNFRRPSIAQIEPIYRVAPLQQSAVLAYLRGRIAAGAKVSELKEIAGPLLSYSLPVVRLLGRSGGVDLAWREELLEAAARITPDEADELADFYLKRNEPEKAATAYQVYVDGASDRVSVSNRCGWLVDYYFQHGEKDKALAIGKMAATVYSYRGLEIYARLLERTGDFAGAEQNFQNIAERYEDNTPLYLFFQRQSKISKDYVAKAKTIESAVFPDGLKPGKAAEFSGVPQRGVIVKEENALLLRNGLHKGDVIVAFDGTRVETFDQFVFLRALADDPKFRLTVYQGGAYRDLAVEAPNRRFGVEMGTLR